MSRANNGGWDFVQEGETYQMKETVLRTAVISRVTVLEDNSDDKYYKFLLRVEESTNPPLQEEFQIEHIKEPGGYWSGMMQIYEEPEYMVNYEWEREAETEEEET